MPTQKRNDYFKKKKSVATIFIMLVTVENKLYINIICSIFNCFCWLFLILSQLLNVEKIDVYVSCTAVVLELCHRTTVCSWAAAFLMWAWQNGGFADHVTQNEVIGRGYHRPSGADNGPDLSLRHTLRYNGSSCSENRNLQPLNGMTCPVLFYKSEQITWMTVRWQ